MVAAVGDVVVVVAAELEWPVFVMLVPLCKAGPRMGLLWWWQWWIENWWIHWWGFWWWHWWLHLLRLFQSALSAGAHKGHLVSTVGREKSTLVQVCAVLCRFLVGLPCSSVLELTGKCETVGCPLLHPPRCLDTA